MARTERKWNDEFIEYTKFIAAHKNYSNMPEPYKKDGSPKWIVSGNSPLGKERAKWWDKKVRDMNLPNRAEVARAIHPKELKGLKPCQICGKKLSIFYIYPNKNTLKRIENLTNLKFSIYQEDIEEIVIKIFQEFKTKHTERIKHLFDIPKEIREGKEELLDYIKKNCLSKLSPGVM